MSLNKEYTFDYENNSDYTFLVCQWNASGTWRLRGLNILYGLKS